VALVRRSSAGRESLGQKPSRRPIRRRNAKGLTQEETNELKATYRACVMLTHEKCVVVDDKGYESWYGRCMKCGRATWLQVSHIEPKGQYPAMRWDIDNALPLCAPCHLFWWHKNPGEAYLWSVEVLGQEKRDELSQRAKIRKQAGAKPDPRAVLLYLKQKRKELET
jgi:5-methylcytosine-specific restriction endonuclease McrA